MANRKRFGQHFLRDRSAVDRILALLAPRRGEAVLEIGPGRGALTDALLARLDRLAAVEVDRDLAAAWRARVPAGRLLLIEGDALELDFAATARALGAERLAVVGNLPYNISKPICARLIDGVAAIDRAVLMFQKEVALRLTAPPGGPDYGPLGILAGFCYAIERAFDLGPGAFAPPPRVDSSVTVWRRRDPVPPPAERDALRRALAAGFAQRRKTLARALRSAWGDDDAARRLERAGIDPALRAQQVPPDGWRRLAATLEAR